MEPLLEKALLARVVREHGPRMQAALVRKFHDLDIAEDALQEAMIAALEQWPGAEAPADPAAWLVRAAYHKGIDRLRRRRLDAKKREAIATAESDLEPAAFPSVGELFAADDCLGLLFLCCHPALAFESQIALTLRSVSCLTTVEIARAFLLPEATMAQRIVRAKAKIRDAKIPFRVPDASEIDARVDAVLAVVYLVFNEGYAATEGPSLVRDDLCNEALRLARLLVDLLPTSGPAAGLRALLLITDARRLARVDASGDLVLLEEQDRTLWNREQIERGLAEVDRAIRLGPPRHPYTLQAAIAALHAIAKTPAETDWAQIASLYEMLAGVASSPIVALNHAVAVAMRDGPDAGLALVDALAAELATEHLFHSARADLLRRAGRHEEARASYGRALALATNPAEKRYLARRLRAS